MFSNVEEMLKENGHMGVYPLIFLPFVGIGKMGSRKACSRAPTGSESHFDALARYPRALPSTPAFVFFTHVVGANGTVAQGGSK